MAVNEDEDVNVRYTLDVNDYVNGLNRIQRETNETSDDIVSNNERSGFSFENMKLKAIAFGVAAGIAIKKTIDWLVQAAEKANDYTMAMRGLQEVSKAYGQDGGAAQKMAKEIESMTKGMVSASQAAQGLKFLISSGYSLDQASEMSKALLNVGAFNNVVGDLGQAFVDSAKGIKTGSIELIENIGLTEKLSSVMKRAGIDTSTGIDITNNAEQAQALYNSVMKQGTIFAGNLDEATKGYNAAMAETEIKIQTLTRNIGEKFQPVMIAVAGIIGKLLDPLIKEPKKASEELEPLITTMEELQGKTELTAEETETLRKTMNSISLLSPNMVTGYDDQGNAIINLSTATTELIKIKGLELQASKAQLELDNIKSENSLKKIKKTTDGYLNQIEALVKSEKQTFNLSKVEEEAFRNKITAEIMDKKRAAFAEQEQLKSEILLREEQIKQIVRTQEELKKVSDLKGYKTVTGKPEKIEGVKKDTSTKISDKNFEKNQAKAIKEATENYMKLSESANKDKRTFDEQMQTENNEYDKARKKAKFEYETKLLLEEQKLITELKKNLAKAINSEEIEADQNFMIDELERFTKAEHEKYMNKLKILTEIEENDKERIKKEAEIAKEVAKKQLEEEKESAKEKADALREINEKIKEINDKKAEDQKIHDGKIKKMSEVAATNLKTYEGDVVAIISRTAAKEQLVSDLRISAKQTEAQVISDLVEGELQSFGDYAKIIGKQVETTLTGIAVESGIQSLYNLAKGLAFTAVGKVDSATAAYAASATFAATAAAAGLGATAAHSINGSIGTQNNDTDTGIPTGADTEDLKNTSREALTEQETIYISQADYKRMSFGLVDSINQALLDGKALKVKR